VHWNTLILLAALALLAWQQQRNKRLMDDLNPDAA
jgi:hypothetical protein